MTVRLLSAGSLLMGLLLACGCDKSQDAPPSFNTALGGAGTGAPFYMPPADGGILKDQTAYQPAKPGGGSGGPRGGDGGGAGGSGEPAVRKVVTDMLFAAIHGDIDTVLDAFNPEHVAALKDNSEARSLLHDTYGKVDALLRESASKLGKEFDLKSITADNYKEMLKKLGPEAEKIDLDQMLIVELQDPTTATVSIKLPASIPNMPADAPSPKIPVLKQDGQWRVQAEAPITEQQVVEMVSGLKMAQKILDKLLSKLVEAQITNDQELQAFFQQQFMLVMAEAMAEAAQEQADAADAKPDEPAEKKDGDGETKSGEGGAEGGGDNPPPAPSGGGRTRDPRRTPP